MTPLPDGRQGKSREKAMRLEQRKEDEQGGKVVKGRSSKTDVDAAREIVVKMKRF